LRSREQDAFLGKIYIYYSNIWPSRLTDIDSNDGRIHYRVLHFHLDTLTQVFKRGQNKLEHSLVQNLHTFIDAYLVPRGFVGLNSKDKYTCTDITMITKGIFSIPFSAKFRGTRDILSFALFCTLFVDSAGRVSEFLWRDQIDLQQPGRFLAWKHIQFFSFPSKSGGVTLRAKVRYNDLKNPILDTSKHKTIPLRFLPTKVASEDSMRHLTTLAIIDGVFDCLKSFEDIQQFRPSQFGSRLKMKDSVLDLPVSHARASYKE
jgi:hypothetical protein